MTATRDLFANQRPVTTLADLLANVWQFGYVTTDLDRAMTFMAERFGLEHCRHLPSGGATFLVGDQPAEWEVKFAMGARGGTIIELIEPVAGEIDFYTRVLPREEPFSVRLHHIATHTAGGEDEWQNINRLLAAANLKVDYTVLIPDRVRAGYVDTTAELGHWLEICQLQQDDIDFFTGLVNDSA
jgi:glyoxalase/bleomycin resistance protein/dioxygenase superfamily protein